MPARTCDLCYFPNGPLDETCYHCGKKLPTLIKKKGGIGDRTRDLYITSVMLYH